MKKSVIYTAVIVAIIAVWCKPTTVASDNSDKSYEAYCDSIWAADPDYYYDVLEETEEYRNYIELNGKWWAE